MHLDIQLQPSWLEIPTRIIGTSQLVVVQFLSEEYAFLEACFEWPLTLCDYQTLYVCLRCCWDCKYHPDAAIVYALVHACYVLAFVYLPWSSDAGRRLHTASILTSGHGI